MTDFDTAMRAAAKRADSAVHKAMRKYAAGEVTDEPEITGILVGRLDAAFDGPVSGVHWKASIVRNGSGVAAEEDRTGADLLIHVELQSPTESYSKGVLVQAKRAEPWQPIPNAELIRLNKQCGKMLDITPASFVFDYAQNSMRCGPASRFVASKERQLYRACTWTSYRFFLELFRCPVGDPRITSAQVSRLPVPHVIHLRGEGEFQSLTA